MASKRRLEAEPSNVYGLMASGRRIGEEAKAVESPAATYPFLWHQVADCYERGTGAGRAGAGRRQERRPGRGRAARGERSEPP